MLLLNNKFGVYKEEFDNQWINHQSVEMRTKLDRLLLIATLLLVGMMFLSVPLGALVFYSGGIGEIYTPNSITDEFAVFVFGIPFRVQVSTSLSTIFSSFLLVYLTMMFISLKWPRASLLHAVKENKLLENPLIAVAVIFSITSFAINLLAILQNSLGIPTGSLKGDKLLLFVQVTRAPLREEFGFRLSIIGAFATIIGVISGKGLASLKCLLLPNSLQDVKSSGRMLLIANIATAFYFGVSHLIYEPDVWQVGKVSQAILAGFVLGWIYIEYGFFAAVLLHWAFNYFLTAVQLYETVFGYFGLLSAMSALTGLLALTYLVRAVYVTIMENKRDLPLQ